MDIKQILLVLIAEEPCEGAVRVASDLARRYGAMVEAVCLYREPGVSGRGDGGATLRRHQETVEALTGPAEASFRTMIVDPGFGEAWTTCPLEGSAEPLMRRARLTDVVVMSTAPVIGDARDAAEKLAFGSGTPCLLVPCGQTARALERVALAWDGSREAKRALDDGLAALKRADRVAVVIVEEDVARGPSAEEASALVRHLARHGIDAEIRNVKADGRPVGRAIVEECRSFAADLVVMGAFGGSRLHERVLGGATRTVLREAACPVLMSR